MKAVEDGEESTRKMSLCGEMGEWEEKRRDEIKAEGLYESVLKQ